MSPSSHRTVAFLDILGFKKKISELPLPDLARKYEYLVDLADVMNRPLNFSADIPSLFPDHPKGKAWCVKHIFSDSIILIADEDHPASCLKLLVYTWRLSQILISQNMSARGAIAYGEIYTNLNKNIILGKGLTDAYQLESKQQWVGICIDDSVAAAYPDLFSNIKDQNNLLRPVFFEYPVPFKDGSCKQLITLNWRINLIAENGTRALFSKDTHGDVFQKIKNTLEYARTVVKSGRIYAYGDNVPVELRTFYIGAKEPPFKHGDDL
jgi:hypothetical protein